MLLVQSHFDVKLDVVESRHEQFHREVGCGGDREFRIKKLDGQKISRLPKTKVSKILNSKVITK